MDTIEKITGYVKDSLGKKNRKKLMENAAVVIIIGIIIIIAGGALRGKSDNKLPQKQGQEGNGTEASMNMQAEKEDNGLEKKLEWILSQMDGVGKVNVMITYESGEEKIPAYDVKKSENETAEKDGSGGTREISGSDYESKIAYEEQSGGSRKPIVLKNRYPVVKGVIVVADGADNMEVREDISRAVQTLMDLPIHKVQVFERKR